MIVGLDLKDDEIDTFYRAVNDWIEGILNPAMSIFPKLIKYRKVGKGFTYLISKIDDKLDSLKKNGPNGSTMSGMYFAKDKEDLSKCLDRSEIISNTLLLILAGLETAASMLTIAMLTLGLHKDILKKLKDEQLALMSNHQGEDMTHDCWKGCRHRPGRLRPIARKHTVTSP
jgi:cytochrome P450